MIETVAVITGGAGGMGLAVAKILGREHRVLIADLQQSRLDAAQAELKDLGVNCDTAICDVTDTASVSALFAQATGLGRVACVIHTAGVSPQMAPPEVIIRVNGLGTINIANAALEIASEGMALINVASNSAHMLPGIMVPTRAFRHAFTDPERFVEKVLKRSNLMRKDFYKKGLAYAFSKSFVLWYSRQIAADFGKLGARVLSVSPGSFDTEMGRLEEKSGSADMLKDAALKRFGRPEEIAEVLAFCASDKASYLTGTDILCDGGVIAGKRG
ncbi:SDR family oxidoreductase [Spongiibacter nanhainus]|uniref:SDR family oxidoreductase n=1 Tax=Spongiibacter nanhainus TaxID=2794344 RepID=A0A7T4R395_9GAMM|nr:SDR family oxidoreductase [Spongiibacter nanhainus]QQD19500.1 SDR family oxidoreductase [Spongiibacter nanhainus]